MQDQVLLCKVVDSWPFRLELVHISVHVSEEEHFRPTAYTYPLPVCFAVQMACASGSAAAWEIDCTVAGMS